MPRGGEICELRKKNTFSRVTQPRTIFFLSVMFRMHSITFLAVCKYYVNTILHFSPPSIMFHIHPLPPFSPFNIVIIVFFLNKLWKCVLMIYIGKKYTMKKIWVE